MAAWSGLGINIKPHIFATPWTAAQRQDNLEYVTEARQHFTKVRVHVPAYQDYGYIDLDKDLANNCKLAGFTNISFGVTSNSVTHANWNDFRDVVLVDDGSGQGAAEWAKRNGMAKFQCGNELEFYLSGVTQPELRDYLRTLWSDIKTLWSGISGPDPILTYSISQGTSATNWIADGNLGDLDQAGYDGYGDNSLATFRSGLAAFYAAFGAKVVVSECNIHATWTSARARGILSSARKFHDWYGAELVDRLNIIRSLGISEAYHFTWNGFSNPSQPDYFAVKLTQYSSATMTGDFIPGGISPALYQLVGSRATSVVVD